MFTLATPSDFTSYPWMQFAFRRVRTEIGGTGDFDSSIVERSRSGGNQGNAVSLKRYPRSRVLEYRWPIGFKTP